MATPKRALLESRLTYHLRCLREDATDPELTALERLALVRDRAARIREIRWELEGVKAMDADWRIEDIL
ncbi:MAG: hypothetical protein ABSD47_12685 [Candidatus Methylomirabilota bacterium]